MKSLSFFMRPRSLSIMSVLTASLMMSCSSLELSSAEDDEVTPHVSVTVDASISIDPSQTYQEVLYGADAKLTMKGWADGNVQQVANRMFSEMNLNLLRIPVYAMREATDPFYDKLITIMDASKTANPNVKFFASVANGDGDQNNNLHGADKFPSSMKGCCSYNIYSLNLTAYAKRLDDFIQMLTDNNHQLDYFGPFNEDPAGISDYQKVFNQMNNLGTTKKVGIETWGLQTAITVQADLEPLLDITGSHFYDDGSIPKSQWISTWGNLVSASSNPVWYSEATRYKTGDNINNLIDGLANIFPAIQAGADQIIFYQTTNRFVYFNGGIQPYKFSGFKHLVNTSENKLKIGSSSSDEDVMVVSFAGQDIAQSHIINSSNVTKTIEINIGGGYYSNADFDEKTWDANNIELLTTNTMSQRISSTKWLVTLAPYSYYSVSVPLMN
ncbi:glycoside hydrolase [Echinicola pacifica]|nr:hypothetical protein [Echinicola pacifica]